MMGGWSILHQRSLPRPWLISGTVTYKVFLTCPHLLSLGFLVITPHPSSPLSVHHPFWNPIPLGMMTQPLTIPVFLPCQCSHLLIFTSSSSVRRPPFQFIVSFGTYQYINIKFTLAWSWSFFHAGSPSCSSFTSFHAGSPSSALSKAISPSHHPPLLCLKRWDGSSIDVK